MTVSTPSASELSAAQEIAAHLSWIRSYATVMTADNWADMALYIRRQVGELEYAAASQAKRIEELEGDCARKDMQLEAASKVALAHGALLSEAEKVLAGLIQVRDKPQLNAARDLITKIREATK